MNKVNHDVYITSLEFGVSKLNSGFEVLDLLHYLTSKGLDVDLNNPQQNMRFFTFLNNSFFTGRDNTRPYSLQEANGLTFFIRPEAYFNYLDNIELNEALKSSREARYYALGAIVVTIVVAIFQINSPVELDTTQYQEIKNIIQKVCR